MLCVERNGRDKITFDLTKEKPWKKSQDTRDSGFPWLGAGNQIFFWFCFCLDLRHVGSLCVCVWLCWVFVAVWAFL